MSVPSRLVTLWKNIFPRIQPYFAVKSNPSPQLVDTLNREGVNFDCASLDEIEFVTSRGVAPNRILFAHTMKFPEHLSRAADLGVNMTTFDGHHELAKIASLHPACRTLLRIRSDDPDAKCLLGKKFGAETHEIRGLLETAKSLGVHVKGVSFHVGSGSKNADAYYDAIALARKTFDEAKGLGFDPDTLDIGGGFCVNHNMTGVEGAVNERINEALDTFFHDPKVRIIAEPGRFFSETFATYTCRVVGKRERGGALEYFLNDGVYGAFGNVIYEKYVPTNVITSKKSDETFDSVLYGPTCDSVDKIGTVRIPKLEVGDTITFERFGAYTSATSTKFNGYGHHDITFTNHWYDPSVGNVSSPKRSRLSLP